MPPKRPPPIEDPPSASSSSEEEEEVEGTSSEEEEEEEEIAPVIKRTQKSSPPPPTTKSNDGESESESESGSETDSDDEGPSPIVKPIASKPMVEEVASTPQKSKKPRSEPATASPRPGKGRAVMDGGEKDGKRAQKKDSETDGEPGEKSKLFQRKWSEEDEITLLNGLIEFKAKKGMDPSKDMSGFFDFIKKDLHFDVALGQLKDKVWRLKKKFENHVNGKKDKTFSKEHDQKAFDLSKKIWGSEGKGSGMESAIKSNGKVKKVVDESSKKVVDESATKAVNEISKKRKGKDLEAWKTELGLVPPKADGKEDGENVVEEKGKKVRVEVVEKWVGFGKVNGSGGMEEYVLSKGMELLEGSKRAEMEGRMRKLHVEELELFLKRNELVKEHAQLLLDAYNKMDED